MTARKEHDQDLQQSRTSSKQDLDIETAAELTDTTMSNQREFRGYAASEPDGTRTEYAGNRSLGWIALALAVGSLFVLPQWFGLAGIVLGGAAWFTGARGIGLWSIVIGSISLVAYVVLVPFYT